MELVAPAGDVYQAGTLSGNPLATAAGLATLRLLDEAAYARLDAHHRARSPRASRPPRRERRAARSPRARPRSRCSSATGRRATTTRPRAATWRPTPPSAAACSSRGVYPPASQFEAWFPSLGAHRRARRADARRRPARHSRSCERARRGGGGARAGAAPRTRSTAPTAPLRGRARFVLEAVHEGYLLHYGEPRAFDGHGRGPAPCWPATRSTRSAWPGWPDGRPRGRAELADLISLREAHAEGRPDARDVVGGKLETAGGAAPARRKRTSTAPCTRPYLSTVKSAERSDACPPWPTPARRGSRPTPRIAEHAGRVRGRDGHPPRPDDRRRAGRRRHRHRWRSSCRRSASRSARSSSRRSASVAGRGFRRRTSTPSSTCSGSSTLVPNVGDSGQDHDLRAHGQPATAPQRRARHR